MSAGTRIVECERDLLPEWIAEVVTTDQLHVPSEQFLWGILLRAAELPHAAKTVGLVLKDHCQNINACHSMGQRLLADECGIGSRHTVITAIETLERAGFLVVDRQMKARTTYCLAWPNNRPTMHRVGRASGAVNAPARSGAVRGSGAIGSQTGAVNAPSGAVDPPNWRGGRATSGVSVESVSKSGSAFADRENFSLSEIDRCGRCDHDGYYSPDRYDPAVRKRCDHDVTKTGVFV